MDDGSGPLQSQEDFYTLLCVRPDGIASVVDVYPAREFAHVSRRAAALLAEHRSCERVEIWRDGALIEELARTPA
jgi:hypothetical protein